MTPADLSALEKLLGHPRFWRLQSTGDWGTWFVEVMPNGDGCPRHFTAPTWPEAVRRAVEAIEGEEATHGT